MAALSATVDAAPCSLLAFGAAGMLYLTVSDLIPTAEQHHYQQSAAIAASAGFLVLLISSHVVR